MLSLFQIIGSISPPPGVIDYRIKSLLVYPHGAVPGLLLFISNLLKLLIVMAGLYAFINVISAGYQFMSAGGEPKKVEQAWAKIYQSLIGLLLIAGSFVLAIIFGWLLFKDPSAILTPQIYGPN